MNSDRLTEAEALLRQVAKDLERNIRYTEGFFDKPNADEAVKNDPTLQRINEHFEKWEID